MSGHHPFSKLTEGFSPEQRRRVDSIKAEMMAEYARFRQSRRDDAPDVADERNPQDDFSERGMG